MDLTVAHGYVPAPGIARETQARLRSDAEDYADRVLEDAILREKRYGTAEALLRRSRVTDSATWVRERVPARHDRSFGTAVQVGLRKETVVLPTHPVDPRAIEDAQQVRADAFVLRNRFDAPDSDVVQDPFTGPAKLYAYEPARRSVVYQGMGPKGVGALVDALKAPVGDYGEPSVIRFDMSNVVGAVRVAPTSAQRPTASFLNPRPNVRTRESVLQARVERGTPAFI